MITIFTSVQRSAVNRLIGEFCEIYSNPPDYTSETNGEIYAAISCLVGETSKECFAENLVCCLTSFDAPPDEINSRLAYEMVIANSEILCRALLETLGKWNEVENL